MLLGWLVTGWVHLTGAARTVTNKAKAQVNNKKLYTDASGVTRYASNGLPQNNFYERVKKGESHNERSIRFWQKKLDEALKQEPNNKAYIKSVENELQKAIEKGKHLDEFMSEFDEEHKKILRKQGYDI